VPAKVYDRPERQGLSPVLIVIALIVLVVVGYGIYRWQFAPAAPANSNSAPAAGQSLLEPRKADYGLFA
jgi:flagellar basal body-associated protein FliL